MSTFAKMRIVPDSKTNNQNKDIVNIIRQQIPSQMKILSELDFEMSDILNSNLDDLTKAKLYSQNLRKYLTHKDIQREESLAKSRPQSPPRTYIPQIIPKAPKKKKKTKDISILHKRSPTKTFHGKKKTITLPIASSKAKSPTEIVEEYKEKTNFINQFINQLATPQTSDVWEKY